jgi:hypothetical protein
MVTIKVSSFKHAVGTKRHHVDEVITRDEEGNPVIVHTMWHSGKRPVCTVCHPELQTEESKGDQS